MSNSGGTETSDLAREWRRKEQMKRKQTKLRRNTKRTTNISSKKQTSILRASPRVTSALSKMRAGVSLSKAAKESKVSPRTVIKRAASALRKNESGRFKAKAGDRLVRSLMIPTPEGAQEISVRGLRVASQLGRYWVSVHKYYETGDTSGLRKFEGAVVTDIDGVKYPLLTDTDVLNRLGSAGVLTFESLYGKSA
jgi:hypothetical protein